MLTRILLPLVVLAVTIAATWYIARITPHKQPSRLATPTTTVPTLVATALPALAAPTTKPLYRLAGTVVGDIRYAIIEAPGGSNDLYHVGESIPGLGTLTDIQANSVSIAGPDGAFDLNLAPGATPTAGQPQQQKNEEVEVEAEPLGDDDPEYRLDDEWTDDDFRDQPYDDY